jgi:hypothetical protein
MSTSPHQAIHADCMRINRLRCTDAIGWDSFASASAYPAPAASKSS